MIYHQCKQGYWRTTRLCSIVDTVFHSTRLNAFKYKVDCECVLSVTFKFLLLLAKLFSRIVLNLLTKFRVVFSLQYAISFIIVVYFM